MFELINGIKENSKILIRDSAYEVLAKVIYVTESNQNEWYAKILLSNHKVLVISPFDNYMYFGFVDEPIHCDFPSPKTIEYNKTLYVKDAEDYQIVKCFEFGDFLMMEGEVAFVDYTSQIDESDIISIGLVTRTKKRADVIAKVLTLDDVSILPKE